MNHKQLIILTHENGRFATKFKGSFKNREGIDLDVLELKRLFEKNGFTCSVSTFSGLDKHRHYAGVFFIYASSEDPGRFYKGFIEDVILSLEKDGAIVIPAYALLHAHADKVFQELQRMHFVNERLRSPASKVFGTYEELEKNAGDITYPCVVKTSAGSGSSGVQLVKDEKELFACAKKLMKVRFFDYSRPMSMRFKLYIWRIIKKIIKHRHVQSISESMYTNKIVVQDYISGLDGDYKVLYFYGRYYVMHRKNRPGDFRASGSGRFEFPADSEQIAGILDLARAAAKELDQPIASLDIVSSASEGCRLIEYQCVYFGPLTMQYSDYYFVYDDNGWQRLKNDNTLEEEYARAICGYISDNCPA